MLLFCSLTPIELISIKYSRCRNNRRLAVSVYTRIMGGSARQLLVWWMMFAVPAHALAADVMGFARNSDAPLVATLDSKAQAHEGCAMDTDPVTCLACTVCATSVILIGTLAPRTEPMLVMRARFVLSAIPTVIFLTDALERPPRTTLA